MKNKKIPISDNMIKLYGEEAEAVNQRCYELNPWFGEFVRAFAYDELWGMEELSFLEKSLLVIGLRSYKTYTFCKPLSEEVMNVGKIECWHHRSRQSCPSLCSSL